MKRLKLYLFVSVAILLTVSCAKKGSEFVGRWKSVNNNIKGNLEIVRNGNNFIVTVQGKNMPATLINGNLEIKTNQLGIETIQITYVEGRDELIINGLNGPQTFRRMNKNDA